MEWPFKPLRRWFSDTVFVVMFKMVLRFWTCKWNSDHSDKSYWAVLSRDTVYYDVQDGSNVSVCGWNPKCDHTNESFWEVFSCDTVYYAVQGGSNVWVCGWNPKVWPFKWKLLSSTFLWYCFMLYKMVLTFESGRKLKVCAFKWKQQYFRLLF